MTSVVSRAPARNGSASMPAPGIEPGARNRPKLPGVVVGVIVTVLGMAAVGVLWASSSQRQPYLAVARPVPAGSIITDADLTIANLPEDGALAPISASSRGRVVGSTAAVDLAPGSLVVAGDLGTASTLQRGEAMVSVEVPAAMAPVGSLHSGDEVQIVKTSKANDDTTPLGAVITTGRVVTVNAGTSSSVIGLAVDVTKAPDVGGAAAAQRVVLLLLPAGSSK